MLSKLHQEQQQIIQNKERLRDALAKQKMFLKRWIKWNVPTV